VSVVAAFTYVVKSDAIGKNVALLEEYKAWVKKRQDLFKSLKSYQIFMKFSGGKFGEFVEMMEFGNLADLQTCYDAVMKDKEYLSIYFPPMVDLIIPGTLGMEIWNPVP